MSVLLESQQEIGIMDKKPGFYVRISPADKHALRLWGDKEKRSATAQAAYVLELAIEKYRGSLA